MQTIFVSSSLRTAGTPSRFTVSLGNGVLRANPKVKTRCAISEATINRSWFNVREGANAVLFQGGITRYIQPGQYSILDIRTAVQAILEEGVTLSFSRINSKFTFTSTLAYTYTIDLLKLAPALGWTLGASTVTLTQSDFMKTSPYPARISNVNAIYIHADLPKMGDTVLDNLYGDAYFGASTIVQKVPVDSPPDDNIIFRSSSLELDMFDLQEGHVDTVTFWVTDERGDPLDLFFDWSFTLVVQHVPTESTDILETLQESRDLLKLAVLSNENVLR